MPCIPIPTLQIPKLPSGVSIGVRTPAFKFDASLCCKIPPIVDIPEIPFGITITSTMMIAINAAIQKANDYIRRLPLECPREIQQALSGGS